MKRGRNVRRVGVRAWVGAIGALLGQALLFVRAPRALRWRIETFGLYMPSLPNARPWFRPNGRALGAFVRQLPAYVHWLGEMRALRRDGPAGWWEARGGTTLDGKLAWLERGYPGDDAGAESRS